MNINHAFFLVIYFSVLVMHAQVDTKTIKHQMKVDAQCDNQEQIFMDLEAHHKNQVYNLTKDYKNEKLTLRFNIIESCCLQFSGESKITKKGLEITYYTSQDKVCECFCKYQFTYTMGISIQDPDKLYINNEYFEIKK